MERCRSFTACGGVNTTSVMGRLRRHRLTFLVFALLKVIVQDQALDALLFFLLRLLLRLHGDGKRRIGWQFHLPGLKFMSAKVINGITARGGGRTCWRLPFLVRSEKAMVVLGILAGPSSPGAIGAEGSRFLGRTGSGTSNSCLRSNFRDSRLSAIILAYSRSNSASSSALTVSSCRVTTIASSLKSLSCAESSSSSCCPSVS